MNIWSQYPGLRFHWPAIHKEAVDQQLDPVMVAAVVLKESGANSDAFRHEPAFWNRYMKAQPQFKGLNPRRYSSSYSLMQPMWVVATEEGFPADLPPELLFVPETNLKYGCKRLKALIAWADKGWPETTAEIRLAASLAAYNGGRGGNRPTDQPNRNASYAKGVLSLYATLLKDHAGA